MCIPVHMDNKKERDREKYHSIVSIASAHNKITKTSPAFLSTVFLPHIALNEFTVTPANVTIPTGQIAVLECESGDSFPPPAIEWIYIDSMNQITIISTLNNTR